MEEAGLIVVDHKREATYCGCFMRKAAAARVDTARSDGVGVSEVRARCWLNDKLEVDVVSEVYRLPTPVEGEARVRIASERSSTDDCCER